MTKKFSGKMKKYQNINPIKLKKNFEKKICFCGSDKPFMHCCGKINTEFMDESDLEIYIENIKDILFEIQEQLSNCLIEYYIEEDKKEFAEHLDFLIKKYGYESIDSFYEDNESNDDEHIIRLDNIIMEEFTITRTLPGFSQPLIKHLYPKLAYKASPLKKELLNSYAESKISLYEIIYKKDPLYMVIQDLFSGKKYELKDWMLASQYTIWDLLCGRICSANGINIFSFEPIHIHSDLMPLILRLLVVSWLKFEMNSKNKAIPDLQLDYPKLFQEFFDPFSSLSSIYNPSFFEFINNNPNILMSTTSDLLLIDFGPQILTLDGFDFELIILSCTLTPEISKKISETVKNIKELTYIPREKELEIPSNEKLFEVYIPLEIDQIEETSEVPNLSDMIKKDIDTLKTFFIDFFNKKMTFHLGKEKYPRDPLETNQFIREIYIGDIFLSENLMKIVTYSNEYKKMIKKLLKPILAEFSLKLEINQFDLENEFEWEEQFIIKTIHLPIKELNNSTILEALQHDQYRKIALALLKDMENKIDLDSVPLKKMRKKYGVKIPEFNFT